jgi:ketosteroid isomerase-like protein
MNKSEIALVRAWHEALNAGDVDRLVALSSDDVEIGGPRGPGKGSGLLRDWAGRAGIRLDMGRVFHRPGTVVVEQQAQWRSPATGEVTGSETVATVFRVREGRVVSIVRHPNRLSALQAADLSEADEVPGA